jgi:uncharacterized metal-binding protein YceD (DUF177 family)
LGVVKDLMKYVIPFAGLKEGRHEFEYNVDDSFFEQFDSSEIKRGKLTVTVILDKNPRMLALDFFIQGTVKTLCDRCLDELDLPIQYQGKLFFKFGEESYELTDEIIILSSSEHKIDISQFIYEFIHLALPYRKIHADIDGASGCNSGMIEKLVHLTPDDNRKKTKNSSWDKLKEITDKN